MKDSINPLNSISSPLLPLKQIEDINFLQQKEKEFEHKKVSIKYRACVVELIKNTAAKILESLFQFNKIDKVFINKISKCEVSDKEEEQLRY